MITITSNAASGEEATARGSYTVTAHAQSDPPPLGTALLALSQLAAHVDLGFRRGSINPHVADRLVVEIDRMAGALNALIPRPRRKRCAP
jgi:hypothetical protein